LRQHLRILFMQRRLAIQKVAESCSISRVTLHRFLSGETDMRSGDFVKVLGKAGLDIPRMLERKLQDDSDDNEAPAMAEFFADVFKCLDRRVQRSVLQNLIWWLNNSDKQTSATLAQRGEQLLRDFNGSKKTAG
jgi:hypothetical protein